MERYKLMRENKGRGLDYRLKKRNEERINRRAQVLAQFRNIKPVSEKKVVKKSRAELLKEWKERKTKQKEISKSNKKPAFVVGKVQYHVNGSINVPLHPIENLIQSNIRKGAVTRSQTKSNINNIPKAKKELFKFEHLTQVDGEKYDVLKNYKFIAPKVIAALSKTLTIPISPKITKSLRKIEVKNSTVLNKANKIVKMSKSKGKKDLKENLELNCGMCGDEQKVVLKPEICSPSPVKEDDVQTSQLLNVTLKKNDGVPEEFTHLLYSPCVEKTRGSSVRRSRKISLMRDVEGDVMQEEKESMSRIIGFRLFLSNETDRLLKLAESWKSLIETEARIPADVEGDINAAVGKTKLLTSDKFKQFESLINKCEGGDNTVKVDDLQGFHDWVMLEVDDLNKAYNKLKERKENNWETTTTPTLHEKKPQKKTVAVKKVQKKAPAASSLRAHIMAARMKKQVGSEGGSESQESVDKENVVKPCTPQQHQPRTSIRKTPREEPLLKSVLLRRCSGLEILAANARARSLSPKKSPACNEPPTLTVLPIVERTPARGILRSTPAVQSVKKNVNFLDPSYLAPVMVIILGNTDPNENISLTESYTIQKTLPWNKRLVPYTCQHLGVSSEIVHRPGGLNVWHNELWQHLRAETLLYS